MKKSILYTIILLLIITNIYFCGAKGDLVLEPEVLPLKIPSLKIKQSGTNIILEFTFSKYLSDKKTEFSISNLTKLYVYHSTSPIPDNKFFKRGNIIKKLNKEDILNKDTKYIVLIPFKLKQLENVNHYFGLRYVYKKKKSPFSNKVSIKTKIPPRVIKTLKVKKLNKIISLEWEKPIINLKNEKLKTISGYKIFKKIESKEDETLSKDFFLLTEKPLLRESYEDDDTSINGTYYYYVISMINPKVESDKSNIVSIEIEDIYPPEIPSNIYTFKAKDHIYITWDKVKDKDFSHFKIYRKTGKKGKFVLISDNITTNYFKDMNVKNGRLYFYYITSVDLKNNESENSEIVSQRF